MTQAANYGPDGFLEVETNYVQLTRFVLVSQSPLADRFKLTGTQVVAPSTGEAVEYLLDAGGWHHREDFRRTINTRYLLAPRACADAGLKLTKSEWLEAVHLGYQPNPVRFPEEALVQSVLDQRKPAIPRPRIRMAFRLEMFMRRQSQYPRFWKAVGVLVAVLIGLVAFYYLWQTVATLTGIYLVARGVGRYLRR